MTTIEVVTPAHLVDEINRYLGIASDEAEALAEIVFTRYSEPQRFYHSLRHISHLLSLLRQHLQEVQDPIAVLAAILFHDIVYDPRSSTNEEDSAGLWTDACDRFPFLTRWRSTVSEYILLTKAHQPPEDVSDSDLIVFLDMDLAILGADRAEYGKYAIDIRREYRHVEAAAFCQARGRFLEEMLARRIFRSPSFLESHEIQAKDNIRWECSILQSGRVVSKPDLIECSATVPLFPFSLNSRNQFAIDCIAKRGVCSLDVVFELTGDLTEVLFEGSQRSNDSIWEHTCVEVFLSLPSEKAYWELNIAPTGNWTISRFSDYRVKTSFATESLRASVSLADLGSNHRRISLCLPLLQLFSPDELSGDLSLNLAAVIENKSGGLSFWSHHHASIKPDFHHKDSFSILI